MKDYEIIMWINKLEPESEKQKRAIKAMENAFRSITENKLDEGINDFIGIYTKEEIVNKASGELYDEYFEYCEDFDYTPVSHSAFSKTIMRTFGLVIRPVKVNNKTVRVYKTL